MLQNWRVGCTMAAPECCQDYYSCLLHAMNQVSVAFLLISAVITKSYPHGEIYELGVNLVAYVARPLMWVGSEMWSAQRKTHVLMAAAKYWQY